MREGSAMVSFTTLLEMMMNRNFAGNCPYGIVCSWKTTAIDILLYEKVLRLQ